MRPTITVAITTRNRARDLEDCLGSLSRQEVGLDALLIVDNGSTDDTAEVVERFRPKLPIRLVREPVPGYPAAYNRALGEAATDWVAFMDSDCVADPRWYGEVVRAAERNPRCAAVLGFSGNYHSRNPFACAFQFSNEWWRWRSVKDGEILDYRVLDSRNILYNAALLRRHGIRFDDSLVLGSEDVDLGLQIHAKGLPARSAAGMIARHKEPRSLGGYFSKKLAYAASQTRLSEKWGRSADVFPRVEGPAPFRRLFASVAADLAGLQKIICSLVVGADILMTKRRLYFLVLKIAQAGRKELR